MDLGALSVEVFTPLIGTVFTVECVDASVELKLVVVEDQERLKESATLPDGTNLYQRNPFTLVFSGPREIVLEGAIYALTHPEFGTFELFLKPYLQGGDATFYDAAFN